jgi:sporulation protein YlmC with PRC-barrel domain
MKSTRWLPIAAAAFALGSGGFAYAQTVPTGLHKAEDKSVMVKPLNVTIDKLEGMELYGPNGQEIGEVGDVLVDSSAKPVAISAEVGGFLGLGEKDVIIGLDQVAKDGDHLTVAMTKDQIKALPDYKG